MLGTTLSQSFLTAKVRIMTLKLKNPLTTLIMHCRPPGYNGLILFCQTHVHAVENTNVEVTLVAIVNDVKSLIFLKIDVEKIRDFKN